MVVLCRFRKEIYKNPANGYTIAVYSAENRKNIPTDAIGEWEGTRCTFTAVGEELPCYKNMEFELEGSWKDTERFGRQLSVERFQVLLPKTEEGIIGYLSSGLIKGIGPVLAAKIVKKFGTHTFGVLEKQPEKLLELNGMSEKKLAEVVRSYRESAGIRELMTYLAPFQVTPRKAERIQEHFGMAAVEIIKENPYRLCEIKGFGFVTVDPIAQVSAGFMPDSPMRIKAALQYILQEAEKEGNLYLENEVLVKEAYALLNRNQESEAVPRRSIIVAGNELVLTDRLLEADVFFENGTDPGVRRAAIYRKENREDERRAVRDIFRLLDAPVKCYEIEQELEEAQAEFGIILAEKQKEAVRMVFHSPVSIITGGPGKGKTTNLRVILRVYEKLKEGGAELLCAPTGRARKRLSESTGYPALTIHKALYLTEETMENVEPGEDEDFLDEDFVIADEFTMADMHLARVLFSRIKSGARVVLVGDVDQLPSVGPGNVFKELIDSGIIPVTVLDVFFRQAKDSRIILNADRMNRGQKGLLYGEDFRFIRADSPEAAAEWVEKIYLQEVAAHGNDLDAVQVLSPFRQKTEAGVGALNRRLQETVNPSAMDKAEWGTAAGVFREGDKVMQTKNVGEISNGDMGVVTLIQKNKDGKQELTVDFGDTEKTYEEEELANLDHAFAATIHKSQGGEYPVVIIPVLENFYPMLKRNVYYTGVTRARERVYLIGTKCALATAIGRTDVGRGNTLLAFRLRQEAERRKKTGKENAA